MNNKTYKINEDYENKIALCKNCHGTQDYHTTKDDYLSLLSLKEKQNLKNLLKIRCVFVVAML